MKFISLTFDDGWKSAIHRAAPILRKYDMPATFYVISDLSATHPEYMRPDDLRVLSLEGHEIAAHTKSHPHLPELADDRMRFDIQGGVRDMVAWGFDPRTFAYPYGQYDERVINEVKKAGFLAARTIEDGFNDIATDPLLLRTVGVHEKHAAADIIARIDEFIAGTSDWFILNFHQVEPAEVLRARGWIWGTTPDVLDSILSFIERERLDIVTLEDGAVRLAGLR